MAQNVPRTAPQGTAPAPPLVCQLDVFDPDQKQRYSLLKQKLTASITERTELPNGYALRFAADADLLLTLADFMTLERLCCPFLNFHLEWEAEGGPIWLRLTGREGVQDVLRPAFSPCKTDDRS
jgi:hypothetical protein